MLKRREKGGREGEGEKEGKGGREGETEETREEREEKEWVFLDYGNSCLKPFLLRGTNPGALL